MSDEALRLAQTPRTEKIVSDLVTNVLHHWVRRDDYEDKEELPNRVQRSLDNYYGEKPTEEIRALERELNALRAECEKLQHGRDAAYAQVIGLQDRALIAESLAERLRAELETARKFIEAFKVAYPNIRQLQDGFATDASWSAWDQSVREDTIRLGAMVFNERKVQ